MGRRAIVSLARLSSSATAYLYGRMIGTRRHGTAAVPNAYRNIPLTLSAPRRACAAHLASASLATFPFRSGGAACTHILDLPLLRLPAPYLHMRSLPYTVSGLGPAIPRAVMVFRIQNLNGAQMDREVWGCYACVQALAPAVGEGGRNTAWGEERWRRRRDAPVPSHVGRGSCSEEGVG
jgi:hypothetical protein